MRFTLIILSFLICNVLSSCPECNIHNYLYGSIHTSSVIYKAKIVESIDEYKAKILVTEILRKKDVDTIEIGNILNVAFYEPSKNIGQSFIFSNPRSYGVSFEVLDIRLEWEVRYLMDTTSKPETVSDAIRLLNSVSTKSNQDGMKYVQEHYEECFDSLKKSITSLRKECERNRKYFYGDYRIENLLNAILIHQGESTLKFLMQEIDNIVDYAHFEPCLDSLIYKGKTPIGHYLHTVLIDTKNHSINNKLFLDRYFEIIKSDSSSVIQFFAYALAYDHLEDIKKIKFMNSEQQKNIMWGVLNTALWNKYYFQRDKIKPLLKVLEKLNEDKDIAKFIDKKFDKF